MRRRGVGGSAQAPQEVSRGAQWRCSLESLHEHSLLERVCEALPMLEVARMLLASQQMLAFEREALPRLLGRRCRPGMQLRTAHAGEVAVFFDYMRDTSKWTAGPNTSKPYNVASRGDVEGDVGAWTALQEGTDWLGFQGLYSNFSPEGCRPSWVSFRVCLHTLDVSCAFFTLSAGRRTWGLQPLLFIFNYRGEDMQTGQRCFALTTQPVSGEVHFLQREEEIRAGVPYEISVHLDWQRGSLQLFIDGDLALRDVAFQAENLPRFIGLYNWRSRASCAFSEIIVGRSQPYRCSSAYPSVWRASQSQCRQGPGRDSIWGTFEHALAAQDVSLRRCVLLLLSIVVALCAALVNSEYIGNFRSFWRNA